MMRRSAGPLPKGRLRFALAGYAMRSAPDALLRRFLARSANSATAAMPAVPDLIRMLRAAGGSLPQPGSDTAFKTLPELAKVQVRDLDVGRHNPVPARLFRLPDGPPAEAALVWVHGGAFLFGDLDMAESHWVGAALAARGIPVLSLDYRKTLGKNHYPAASDDVMTGWFWAQDHLDELGSVSADRLHIGGASAGGNLAAGVVKRLRDEAGPLPASTFLAYPTVHSEIPPWDPAALTAVKQAAGASFLAPDWIRDVRLNYAGSVEMLKNPYAVPGEGDLGGQPRTFILTCEYDSVRTSGELYARQLADAGVPVELHRVEGARHGSLNEPFSPGGTESLNRLAEWLTR